MAAVFAFYVLSGYSQNKNKTVKTTHERGAWGNKWTNLELVLLLFLLLISFCFV